MFVKRKMAEPILQPSAIKPAQQGGAVDHIAAASAMVVVGLGVTQLFTPLFVSPMTGLESSRAAQIIAMQWILFGAFLFFGGLFRIRVATIFSAEFLMFVGLSGVAASIYRQGDMVPLMVHGAIAFTGLTNTGLARLADKAELKRELKIMKASNEEARKKYEIRDSGEHDGDEKVRF